MRQRLLQCCLFLGLIGADQSTKWLVVQNVKGKEHIPLIPNVLELVYSENTGAVFGNFKGQGILLLAATIVMVGGILWLYFRLPAAKKWNRLRILGAILLAGAAGNMIDRMIRGYVVDFIYFKPIDFPVFNLADCCLVVSLVLIMVLICFFYSNDDLKEIKLWGKPEQTEADMDKPD